MVLGCPSQSHLAKGHKDWASVSFYVFLGVLGEAPEHVPFDISPPFMNGCFGVRVRVRV